MDWKFSLSDNSLWLLKEKPLWHRQKWHRISTFMSGFENNACYRQEWLTFPPYQQFTLSSLMCYCWSILQDWFIWFQRYLSEHRRENILIPSLYRIHSSQRIEPYNVLPVEMRCRLPSWCGNAYMEQIQSQIRQFIHLPEAPARSITSQLPD